MVRTSKIHIALVQMDKQIEKKVSCPVGAKKFSVLVKGELLLILLLPCMEYKP